MRSDRDDHDEDFIFENDLYEQNAIGVYHAFSQSSVWIDDGDEHRVEKMDPVHRRNCINFVRDRAGALQRMYMDGAMLYAINLGHSREMSEIAQEDVLSGIAQDMQIKSIEELPLMRALIAAQDKWERDGDFISI